MAAPPYAEYRADGWPLCPSCGEDELYSLDEPATVESIVGCYRCAPTMARGRESRERFVQRLVALVGGASYESRQ